MRADVESMSAWLCSWTAVSEESCIRKTVDERGFTPGPVGLADPIAEDEAATGTPYALM
jgi:hypothetical protein